MTAPAEPAAAVVELRRLGWKPSSSRVTPAARSSCEPPACGDPRGTARDGSLGLRDDVVHPLCEVAVLAEVPRLDDDAVAFGFQLWGGPFRPNPVGAGVADEESVPWPSAPAAQKAFSAVSET